MALPWVCYILHDDASYLAASMQSFQKTKNVFTFGEVRRAGTRLKCLLLRVQKVGKHIACMGVLLVGLTRVLPCHAQIILNRPGGERRNIADWIATGTNPIEIRAAAIRDKVLAAAIRKGCRTRRIDVLVDHSSPELRALIGRKNLRVRISTRNQRGRFGSRKLDCSFVLEVGKGAYQQWSGPLVWTKATFGPVTQFFAGSGEGLSATFAIRHRTFNRDFAAALVVHAVKRP